MMDKKRKIIDQYLEQLLPQNGVLSETARYAVLGGGKRLRPILTLLTAEALGANSQSALAPACAIELIHAYSLIHDDLPCMDNDDFRRGRPTVHKAFSEGIAVLTGDHLLTLAFNILSCASTLTDKQKVGLTQVISHAAGDKGMIGGQIMDLGLEGTSPESLRKVHQLKTGALIAAAVEAGAIVANASDQTCATLRTTGLELGLAFQIVDDILDVTQSETKHGRKVSTDARNDKTTYVTLFGLEGARREADNLLRSAKARLDQLPHDCTPLAAIADQLINREA